MAKTRVRFGMRVVDPERPYWEIVAITPRERCFRLGHAPCDADKYGRWPAIMKTEDFTLEYAVKCWKEDRRNWLPDYRGGGGVAVWLNGN